MAEERSGRIEHHGSSYINKRQLCVTCGSDYEAKILILVTTRIDLSNGHCYECRAKMAIEAKEQELSNTKSLFAKARREWRNRSGIPPKFMNEDFSTFDNKREGNLKTIYKTCLDYANGFPVEYIKHVELKGKAYHSLVLFSENWGCGKSHLACSIIHRIFDRWEGQNINMPCEFISEPVLYRSIQATCNYTSEEKSYRESENDIIRRLVYK